MNHEETYIQSVKDRNEWFRNKSVVKLTHGQIDQLIRHAFRAGEKNRQPDFMDSFQNLTGIKQ
jgi:hypothetical protein